MSLWHANRAAASGKWCDGFVVAEFVDLILGFPPQQETFDLRLGVQYTYTHTHIHTPLSDCKLMVIGVYDNLIS